MSWFKEIDVDRDYMSVSVGESSTSIPRRLTEQVIKGYYELLSADTVMSYQEFFAAMRAIDRAWMTAYVAKQEKNALRTKRPAPGKPRR